MYITGLNLVNFKSHLNSEIEFRNITLLTGLNSSGKSSIFQALRMFWQYLNMHDIVLNEYGELWTLANTSYDSERTFKLKLYLDGKEICELFSIREHNHFGSIGGVKEIEFIALNYISASRFGPTEFQYIRNSNTSQYHNVGINGEYTLDILSKYGEVLLPEIFKDEITKQNTLINHVEKWLQEISPNVKLQSEVNKKMNVASFSINGYTPYNVGFGISYTLSIIVQLFYSMYLYNQEGKKAVLLIENPEAHLHPKGQTKLAQLIAKISNFGVQIIIETHSDYILDGLRIAVKDKIIDKEKTKLYYFELDEKSNTKVVSPKIGEDGHLDKWPENFFDTSLDNKMRLM